MKYPFSFALLLCVAQVFAQSESKTPELQVVGVAELKVTPDLGVMNIHITAKDMDFGKSITKLNDKTTAIVRQITGIGFKQADVKTVDFRVSENKIYRREQMIDSGYIASQSVQVEFKSAKETIAKILDTFSKGKTDFVLSFNFKLSDELEKKTKEDMMRIAVQDARHKANVLAEAAQVKLKRIRVIQHSDGGYRPQPMQYKAMDSRMASAESNFGFTPSDLQYNDSVSIIWEVE